VRRARGRKLLVAAKDATGKEHRETTLRPVDDPDVMIRREPACCGECGAGLMDAPVFDELRQKVFDTPEPAPRPLVTEYRVLAKTCSDGGATTVGEVPAFARGRAQYGPGLAARAAWLVCAHHLPNRRAASVIAALGAPVSTGWAASVRGRAARRLQTSFLPWCVS
jgi:transposase